MSILAESYFPYPGVDYGEIPLTIIQCLCSRNNNDDLGSHPWKFSLCRPANTYQIISSEATKTEIQHIKGMKWGYHKATIILCSCLSTLSAASDNVQLQSYRQTRAEQTVTTRQEGARSTADS